MNWTSLIGPAVVAAAISALVATIGIWISARTARRIHTEKLAFDREEAERRFMREVGMTEAKIKADSALAQRKLDLDRAFEAWKRKTEFAEQILADFYEGKEIIEAARSPAGWANEGKTRPREAWESEAESGSLNSYFRTTERLMNKGEFFSQVFARRYRCMALFGREAAAPFDELWKVRNEILVAVRMLIDTHRYRGEGSLPDNRRAWETTIGWVGMDVDPIAVRLAAAVDAIESIFRPAIEDIQT